MVMSKEIHQGDHMRAFNHKNLGRSPLPFQKKISPSGWWSRPISWFSSVGFEIGSVGLVADSEHTIWRSLNLTD